MPSLPIAGAPRATESIWRREPYRIFFPLGMLLLWAGVLHWLLLALGVIGEYRSIFHAMTQIQGVMTSFAVGFLFTMIPRRTQSPPPSVVEIALAVLAPIALSVAAWFEHWALAQVFWLVLMGTLIFFAATRVRGVNAVPDSFLWVAAGILDGIGASILTGAGAMSGAMWLHDIGRAMLLQGMIACFVLGVGPMLLPMITRGDVPSGAGSARAKALHGIGAVLFLASFFGETLAPHAGLEPVTGLRVAAGLRALIATAVLVFAAKAWRLPTLRGFHRRLAWNAMWMLPLGFALLAAFPEWKRGMLHVVFIGCYATLVFAISLHVILSHGGHVAILDSRPRWIVAGALLLALALGARILVDLDPPHFRLWLGIAAASVLAVTVLWGAFLLPRMRRPAA